MAVDVTNLGWVLKDLGELQEARKYLERALKIDEKVYGLDHKSTKTARTNLDDLNGR